MKHFQCNLRLAAVLIAFVASPLAAQPLQTGLTTDLTLNHDDRTRTWDVFVPEGASPANPAPLVLDLHGTFGSGDSQRADSQFLAVAEEHGFVVAWPDSLGDSWRAFSRFGPAGVDDVGFLLALVDEIGSRAAIDPARVYVTGTSNGGAMTQRLACDAADVFAAFVALAAATPAGDLNGCTPVRPVPMLTLRARNDQLIPFGGGETEEVNFMTIEVRSAIEEREWWRERAGCAGAGPDVTEFPGPTTECTRYTNCDAGVEVGMCALESDGLFNHVLYDNIDEVDVAAEAWEFMQRFELPAEFIDEDPVVIDETFDGSWTGPADAQGLLLDYIAPADAVFAAWFTYTLDPVTPMDPPEPGIGAPGQRWLVATLQVSAAGNSASGELVAPAGGAFEAGEQPGQVSSPVGTLSIEFTACDHGWVDYSIDTAVVSGSFEVQPLAAVVAGDAFSCGGTSSAD